jgi:hypothetical protein
MIRWGPRRHAGLRLALGGLTMEPKPTVAPKPGIVWPLVSAVLVGLAIAWLDNQQGWDDGPQPDCSCRCGPSPLCRYAWL